MPNTAAYGNFDIHFYNGQDEIDKDGILKIASSYRRTVNHPEYLPEWDPSEKYSPLQFHPYYDPALKASSTFANFPMNSAKLTPITPKLGTEVTGVQLTQLSDTAKNDLALLVAQRGVLVFRDQDFVEKGPGYVENYGKHFGKLHIHQTSGAPKGHPYIHVTFRRPDHSEFERVFKDATTSINWHTDVSYELQPPSYTFFATLEGPQAGGDTLFADSIEAFERLSPSFQEYLSTLHVVHSSYEQAGNSASLGGIQRRKPVTNIHPLVRVHPVLKRKSLFVNKGFSRRIVELKKPESDALLDFLYNLVNNSLDLQLRVNYRPGTVAIWDNRRVQHSATIDWEEPVTRHNFRITPQGERPVEDLKYLNESEYLQNLFVL